MAATGARGGIRPKDFLGIDALLSDEERDIRDTVRAFVADRVLPNVSEWFEEARIPIELARELGQIGVLGMHLDGYGCADLPELPRKLDRNPRLLEPLADIR